MRSIECPSSCLLFRIMKANGDDNVISSVVGLSVTGVYVSIGQVRKLRTDLDGIFWVVRLRRGQSD